MYAIKIQDAVGIITQSTGVVGGYVESFDPDAHRGRGDLKATADIAKAKLFETPAKAMEFYRQHSTIRPFREDGEPNRPLCAFTVEFVPVHIAH